MWGWKMGEDLFMEFLYGCFFNDFPYYIKYPNPVGANGIRPFVVWIPC
jgi:hypothetical protein